MYDNVHAAAYLVDTVEPGGYNMNQGDLNGEYPIHNACNFSRKDTFQYLFETLDYQSQVNTLTDSQERTMAHAVSMRGGAEDQAARVAITEMLIAAKANFFALDKYGIPPIVYAQVNYPYLVPVILGMPNKASLTDAELIEALQNNPSFVDSLKEKGLADGPLLDVYTQALNPIQGDLLQQMARLKLAAGEEAAQAASLSENAAKSTVEKRAHI